MRAKEKRSRTPDSMRSTRTTESGKALKAERSWAEQAFF
jgi:hypothetical protein